MEDYEAKRFVGKAENITVGEMLDMWIEEDLKPSSLSNGTVMAYTAAVKKIKKYPIGQPQAENRHSRPFAGVH